MRAMKARRRLLDGAQKRNARAECHALSSRFALSAGGACTFAGLAVMLVGGMALRASGPALGDRSVSVQAALPVTPPSSQILEQRLFDLPAVDDDPAWLGAGTGLPEPTRVAIASSVADALEQKRLPGCVVVVGRRDRILYHRAFGRRQIEPASVPMTEDTAFDLASLTKPLATATSIMILAERGLVRLDDPAARFIPEFAAHDKGKVTLRQLLLHVAGLPAGTALDDYEHGREEAMRRIADLHLRAAPGTKFIYSDVGYLVLEEIVRRVTGQDFASFVRDAITGPLGMAETGFLPAASLRDRAATTEQRDGSWIRGEVHDPRAFLLGGVAGHAGLFSTARDVSTYARAMLGGGAVHGRRILLPRSVRTMMAPHDIPDGIRALGWDISSRYSGNRGTTLSRHAVGHGGYTGTSLWIDPDQDLFVLFLSNRVHPDGKGAILELAGRIGTLAGEVVASSGERALPTPSSSTLSERPVRSVSFGIDVLAENGFRTLRGARIGLVTNDSARARSGERTVDLMRRASDVHLVALFSPEHGLGANSDERVPDSIDSASGLVVHSLYGKTLGPTTDMLSGIDTLVFDLQDAGARFYTYASTLHRAMKVAAAGDLRLVVLDRPNPIDGVDVAGPVSKANEASFVNHYPLPVRHAMTMGELAEMINADEHLATRLEVVKMSGWQRTDYFDDTGREWLPPSPNLRTVTTALLYPGIALLEGTNVSVGRGTDRPFELVGAPWIDGEALAAALAQQELVGLSVRPTTFRPAASVHAGVLCHGISLEVLDRTRFDPLRTGLTIAVELAKRHPHDWNTSKLGDIIASRVVTQAILDARPWSTLENTWKEDLDVFRAKRARYLLYPTP